MFRAPLTIELKRLIGKSIRDQKDPGHSLRLMSIVEE
jgi:hypothetical protein